VAQMNKLIKSPIQNAIQYTFFLSILYAIYKFFDINSPKGSEFISYIVPLVLTNIVLVAFPILFIYFFFRDGVAIDEIKETFVKKKDTQVSEFNNQEILREYHGMLKDGIITQEEYDSIKKKYLKDVHKNM
jgi:hypothetical protein